MSAALGGPRLEARVAWEKGDAQGPVAEVAHDGVGRVIVSAGDGPLDVVFPVASSTPACHLACRRQPRRDRGVDAAPAPPK